MVDAVTLAMAKAAMKDRAGTRLSSIEVISTDNVGSEIVERATPRMLTRESARVPMLEKHASNPILEWSSATSVNKLSSIYWPCAIYVEGLIEDPLGNFYMYLSTDHGQVQGGPSSDVTSGIALAYSDSPTGPFTWYNDGAYIYRDTHSGNGTETPTVLPMPSGFAWTDSGGNPHVGGLFMYYQQKNASGSTAYQTTLVAFSADGINWTRHGVVLDVNTGDSPVFGGHFGYAKVFLIGGLYVAYHLLGGSAGRSEMGVSYSRNGINFQMHPSYLGNSNEQTGYPDKRFAWHGGNIVNWSGQPYAISGVQDIVASGETNSVITWHMGPLSPNLRTISAPTIDITPPAQAWEWNATLAAHVTGGIASALEYRGDTYLYYRGVGPWGGIGVAKIVPNPAGAYKYPPGASSLARALIRDPAGEIVPRGRIVTERKWEFWDNTVPAGLEVTATTTGTGVITPASSGTPHIAIQTAATSGDTVRLRTNFDIDPSYYQALSITIEGAWVESANDQFDVYLFLQDAASTAGIQFGNTVSGGNDGFIRPAGSGAVPSVYYRWRVDPTRRRNLTLRWDRTAGAAFLLEDDAVVSYVSVTGIGAGTIRPGIALATRSAAVRKMHISKMKLRLEHNQ